MPQTKAQPTGPSTLLKTLETEMERNWSAFKKLPTPPFYLAYEITEYESATVTGSFGTLVSASAADKTRFLDIDLRVGSPNLDNYHPVRGSMFNMLDNFNPVTIPIEDDPAAIRAAIWYQTDQRYKRSIEQWIAVQTNVKVKAENTDKAGDFSAGPVESFVEPVVKLTGFDRKLWEEKVRKYTKPFRRFGNVYQAEARLNISIETRIFVNSEGSRIQTSQPYYRLGITGFAKADDGMELPKAEYWHSSTMEGLPTDEVVLAKVDQITKDLMKLKLAPVMEPYSGPAILSPRATGVFFHEIFGHRIEGQRTKNEDDGQTFKDKVGQKILPEFLNVYSDPTLKKYGASELAGFYRFDNQGIKARRVTVVDKGIFKNYLMSRIPIDGFPASNGHGRRQAGYNVEARQSNLIVEATQTITREELKQKLIEEVTKTKLPYGLFFDDVQGGFTMTGRQGPSAFTVIPVMTYRIYPDGREELVRGVDLIGTPLTTFGKIIAAANDPSVFNGICGATSGQVPVSAGGPSLLVSQVEIQKKPKSQERSPILPPPFDDPNIGTWREFIFGANL